jgi:hypothetical protein
MQMPRNSGERGVDMYRLFRETWQSYARWGEVLGKQGLDQSSDFDCDVGYTAIEEIVKAFQALVNSEKIHLADLLRITDDRLAPFSDPLRLPFVRHRWLDPRREREESYSDWLAWLLEGMDSADRVLRVFDLEDSAFGAIVRREEPTITREEEFRTSSGELKRLDVVIRFGDAGILLVEVKIREIGVAGGAGNLPIYRAWLESRQPDPRRRYSILLVPDPMEAPVGWEVRSWDRVSLRLRLQAAVCDVSIPGSRLFAAMLLCFAGAVEQNLLGLDGRGDADSAPQTALYLERFLQESRS